MHYNDRTEVVMADLDVKLFDYLAQRHFDLMPPAVRARFDDYAKTRNFKGNMKYWDEHFKDAPTPDLEGDDSDNYKLTNTEWNDLYDACQRTLQKMNENQTANVGFANPYKPATQKFISTWFGSFDDDKVFVPTEAKPNIDQFLFRQGPKASPAPKENLADFLSDTKWSAEFKGIFRRNLKDINYDDFINGLQTKRYNSDDKFKQQLLTVIDYIIQYGPKEGDSVPDPRYWPKGAGYTQQLGSFYYEVKKVDPVFSNIRKNEDMSEWFEVPSKHREECIQRFKDNYAEIFDKLLTQSGVRSDFVAQVDYGDKKIVSDPLLTAIAQTDYSNKESDDFVAEKYDDEKHWKQKFEDWKDDLYEDYFRKFVNPSRGTRKYFSPWSQDIIKAFDKVKIKPTDGLEGILAKKSEILEKLKDKFKTPIDHFNWFTNTIEKLQASGMKKTVEGALRNGQQLQKLVSSIIVEAVNNGNKIKEAKTALEILSVAKYGLSSSRTYEKIKEASKNINIFSNSKLSYANTPAGEFGKIVDNVLGATIRGAAAVGMGIRNAVSLSRTKIDYDTSKNKILDAGHRIWNEEHLIDQINAHEKQLKDLADGKGESGEKIDKSSIDSLEQDLENMQDDDPNKEKLQHDIDLYKKLKTNESAEANEKRLISARQAKRKDDISSEADYGKTNDPYKELIAYWNMLETIGQTHAFTLGSMKVKRKEMLEGFVNDESKAQDQFKKYLQNFKMRGDMAA